jgi:hypothetical protein
MEPAARTTDLHTQVAITQTTQAGQTIVAHIAKKNRDGTETPTDYSCTFSVNVLVTPTYIPLIGFLDSTASNYRAVQTCPVPLLSSIFTSVTLLFNDDEPSWASGATSQCTNGTCQNTTAAQMATCGEGIGCGGNYAASGGTTMTLQSGYVWTTPGNCEFTNPSQQTLECTAETGEVPIAPIQ